MNELLIFEGLPDTVEPTFFKWCVYVNGKVTFFRDDNGTLLALNGVPSNEPDIYYIPTNILVTNPRLNKSYNLVRDVDCVEVYCTETDKYNFGYIGGVYQLLSKTATMLADNDISINVAQKNTRLINIIAADDQNTKNSVDIVFKKMYAGEPYAVVQSNLISDLKAVPLTATSTNSAIVQLVELHQYILSHFYEALGIQTHDNMKKERLITAELNEDPALVRMNIENIYTTVKSGIEKVNEMFGTNITVEINPLIVKNDITQTEPQSDAEPSDTAEVETAASGNDLPEEPEQTEAATEEDPAEPKEADNSQSDVSDQSEQEENETSETGQEITINIADDATANIVIAQEIEEGDKDADIHDTDNDSKTLD
ncbi:MAG: hypothetical protein K2I06_08390 [Ruminococcus sp.]|nr:hypothetical protein [Ruminococcus sp.]